MSNKCCRSSPRCAFCPVRLLAAARTRREPTETAALVTEVLAGRAPRPLPACVTAALDRFDDLAAPNRKARGEAAAKIP